MSEVAAVTERVVAGARCTRCSGRMMVDKTEGDAACFTCGHVVYRVPPLDNAEVVRREPRRTFHNRLKLS